MKTLKLESRQQAVWLDAGPPPADASGPAHGATPEHMVLINALPQVLVPLSADQVFVRGMYVANDQVWKDGRRVFDPSALAEIVPLMRGIPVQINHDTFGAAGLPVGRWFDASLIVRPDGSQWVRALFFLPADEANAQLVSRIDAGAVSEGSLQLEFQTYACSIDGEPVGECPHMPGDEYDGVTALGVVKDVTAVWEASLVWSGMLEGTSMFIAASRHSAAIPVEELEARAAARQRAEQDPWRKFWATTSADQWATFWRGEHASLAVCPYHASEKAPEGDAWDAAAEMAKETTPAGWKEMCTWFDSEKPDLKGSYKLPHHTGDGGHKVVWRGVAAAMAALMGARGTSIPDGDRRGCYEHLKRHYAQFSKEPPEFK